ncbi:MAG: hypothetical protein QOJ15_2674 [Bradyrhizobium sp.]|jgi:hypothetical protein|nr:hypothetical protein [Bradyrhizobium sp.]
MTSFVVDAARRAPQKAVITREKRVFQYAAASRLIISVSGILDRPVKPGDDNSGPAMTTEFVRGIDEANYAAGTGKAVTDLIFSIAKREVTFFSGTAPISFL